MAETEAGESEHVVRGRSLAVRGGLAVLLAVGANALVVLGTDALGIAPAFRALTVPLVAFLSAAGAAGAGVVYALLVPRADRPNRTFRRVAGAVLVASFVPDLALLVADPSATVPGVVVLMGMHVVVAVVAVALIPGESGERP
jgi:hypothetical protein